VRLDKNLYQADKYELKIKPEVETDTFSGHATIEISLKDQDLELINLHMKNLTVTKFQITQ
jgi:hypothetical protein